MRAGGTRYRSELVKPGDGVLFDIGKPEEKEPGGRVWKVERQVAGQSFIARRTCRCGLGIRAGCDRLESRYLVGCDVYRTDDPALRKRLEQSYSQDKTARRVPLSARVSGEVGGALTLTLTDRRESDRHRGVARPARSRHASSRRHRKRFASSFRGSATRRSSWANSRSNCRLG